MPETLTIRPFREDDLPQVLEVMRLALGEPPGLRRTAELFRWKHFENPFGRSLLLVAEDGDRIAGMRAFMRWDLSFRGEGAVRCVRAVDTATHPRYQRRGIFRDLTLAGLDLAAAEGIDLVFNTPNVKSGAGYLTMGWQPVGKIGVMARPSARWLIHPGRRGDWPLGDRRGFGSVFNPDVHPALWARPSGGLRTTRTAAYLRWRYASHPTARYLLASGGNGVAVARPHLRNGRRELVLSELAGPGAPRAARDLVAEAKPDYLVGWFASGSPERRLALRTLLVPVPGVSALTLMTRPLRDLPFDPTAMSTWDMSLGDLELL